MQVYGCKCICAGESTYTSTTVYMIICRFVNDLLNTLYPLAAAQCRSMPNKPTPYRTNRAWIVKNWCEIAIWFGLRQPNPYDVVWTRWTLAARNARRWSKTVIEKPIAIFFAQNVFSVNPKIKGPENPKYHLLPISTEEVWQCCVSVCVGDKVYIQCCVWKSCVKELWKSCVCVWKCCMWKRLVAETPLRCLLEEVDMWGYLLICDRVVSPAPNAPHGTALHHPTPRHQPCMHATYIHPYTHIHAGIALHRVAWHTIT